MDNLEKLKVKVDKLNEEETINFVTEAIKVDDTDKIIAEIQRNYRLVNNTTKRIEKQLQYVEDKQNRILELLKYKEIDTDEIKRRQEIEELEQKLSRLKGV